MVERRFSGNDNRETVSTVSLAMQPAIRGVSLSVVNQHSDIVLESFEPGFDAATLAKTGECMKLFELVLLSKANTANLSKYVPATIGKHNAIMLLARHEGNVVGAMYCYRNDGELIFAAAAISPAHSGQRIASALAAMALLHDFTAFGDLRDVKCVVQGYEDERPSEPASMIFQCLGPLETGSEKFQFKEDYKDRHLFDGAQAPDDGNALIRYRRRCGGGPETLARARLFLSAWSRSILSFPKQLGG